MEYKSIKIMVGGKVQGVFYRKSTKLKADDLGLVGSVRNNPDGSVTIVVQGKKVDIEELIDWCKTGTDEAEVRCLTTEEIDTADYDNFSIIH
ncbi:MAG: acylphosphatase [Chlorobiota bacterium]